MKNAKNEEQRKMKDYKKTTLWLGVSITPRK